MIGFADNLGLFGVGFCMFQVLMGRASSLVCYRPLHELIWVGTACVHMALVSRGMTCTLVLFL